MMCSQSIEIKHFLKYYESLIDCNIEEVSQSIIDNDVIILAEYPKQTAQVKYKSATFDLENIDKQDFTLSPSSGEESITAPPHVACDLINNITVLLEDYNRAITTGFSKGVTH